MNTRLLVLGVLHRGDFHPYEIKRRLEAAMVECYIDVDVGTLYYAVRQLEKDELITAVAEERVARGGMRTIYRITDKGRTEFREGLHRQFDAEGPVSRTLIWRAALPSSRRPQRRRGLRSAEGSRGSTSSIEKLGPVREELAPVLSTGGEHLLRHLDQQRRLDRSWAKSLLAEIVANGIRDVADPSRLAAKS